MAWSFSYLAYRIHPQCFQWIWTFVGGTLTMLAFWLPKGSRRISSMNWPFSFSSSRLGCDSSITACVSHLLQPNSHPETSIKFHQRLAFSRTFPRLPPAAALALVNSTFLSFASVRQSASASRNFYDFRACFCPRGIFAHFWAWNAHQTWVSPHFSSSGSGWANAPQTCWRCIWLPPHGHSASKSSLHRTCYSGCVASLSLSNSWLDPCSCDGATAPQLFD